MLAGIGADIVAMACLTVVAALTQGDGGSLVSGVCLALAFSTLPRIVWQFYLFLQTDIYFLAATVLGCIDLHGTSRQWLANRVNRVLGRHDRLVDESTWHPHDRRAARWYGPLMVAGYTAAVVMAVFVAVPLAWHFSAAPSRRCCHRTTRRPPTSGTPPCCSSCRGAHVSLAGYLAWRDRRRDRTADRHDQHHLGASRTMTTPVTPGTSAVRRRRRRRHAAACLDRRPPPTPRPVHRGGSSPASSSRGACSAGPTSFAGHDIELLTVAPELAALISCDRETLTSSATAGGAHPLLSAARTSTGAHGLVDLLNDYVTRLGVERTLVITRVDEADATDAEWLAILLRRAHPHLLRLTITSSDALTATSATPPPATPPSRCDRRRRMAPRRPDDDVDVHECRPALRRQRRHRHRAGSRRRLSKPSTPPSAPAFTTSGRRSWRRPPVRQRGSAPSPTTVSTAAIPTAQASPPSSSPSSRAC